MNTLNFIQSDIHICTVARATIPNLSPVLDPRFKTKKVILIHTADFLNEAQNLQKTYQLYQIKTEFIQIDSAFDFSRLRVQLGRFINQIADQNPVINITAGAKPISIVLFELAKKHNLATYYLNTNDTISWVVPEQPETYALEDRIKLKPFLMAHGLTLNKHHQPSSNKTIRDALDLLIQELPKYKKAIPQLNYYAYTASKNLISKPLEDNLENLKSLVGLFEETSLFKINNNRIVFKDEDARFFANGGWLEEFLYHQLKQLSSKIPTLQHSLCGVEVTNTKNSVSNEIDNLVLCNNNLFLIECKTKRFTDDGKPDGGAVQSVYKLDTLMDALGGPLAKGLMVSIFNPTNADKERAKQHNIKILTLDDLGSIKKHLTQWLTETPSW